MTLDWEDLFKRVKNHQCPTIEPKTCPYADLHCSVCWGIYIQTLVIDEYTADVNES